MLSLGTSGDAHDGAGQLDLDDGGSDLDNRRDGESLGRFRGLGQGHRKHGWKCRSAAPLVQRHPAAQLIGINSELHGQAGDRVPGMKACSTIQALNVGANMRLPLLRRRSTAAPPGQSGVCPLYCIADAMV